jgi:hypothetical protein
MRPMSGRFSEDTRMALLFLPSAPDVVQLSQVISEVTAPASYRFGDPLDQQDQTVDACL